MEAAPVTRNQLQGILHTQLHRGRELRAPTYYAVVKGYNDSQVGTYNLHVESSGASVAPVSTTMAMTANGAKYFGFDTPAEGAYLTASVAGLTGFNVTPLRFTLFNGKGQIIEGYEPAG